MSYENFLRDMHGRMAREVSTSSVLQAELERDLARRIAEDEARLAAMTEEERAAELYRRRLEAAEWRFRQALDFRPRCDC